MKNLFKAQNEHCKVRYIVYTTTSYVPYEMSIWYPEVSIEDTR